jgi:hypothetical protein
MSGLTDPYLKLDWAKKHLDTLDADLLAFHNSNPCRVFTRDDIENQRYILRIELKDVPDHIPLRCGDAFYCMRSCLDQLVWRLASLRVEVPGRTQFPTIESWDRDNGSARFIASLPDVPDEAIAIIRDLQPANRTTPPQDHLLWQLNAMCNLDKHRKIPAQGSRVAVQLPTPPGTFVHEEFRNNTILSVPLAEKAKLDMHPEVGFQVVFGDAAARVLIGPEEIREIYQFISDGILPKFTRFFA